MFAYFILRLVLPFIIFVAISSVGYGNLVDSISIGIYKVEELNLIGADLKYPDDGDYQLMNNLDATNFTNPISEFSGSIDGNNNAIYHLTTCLFDTLIGNSIVKNLTILNANIINATCSSAIAGVMHNNATVAGIIIAYSNFNSTDNDDAVGMVVGIMTDTSVAHDIKIAYSKTTVYGSGSKVASVVGYMKKNSKVMNVVSFNITIIAKNNYTDAGIAAGRMRGYSIVKDTIAINTNIRTKMYDSNIGVCAGSMDWMSVCSNIASINTSITIPRGNNAFSGFGVGYMIGNSKLQNTIAINGYIIALEVFITNHVKSYVGAGAGYMFGYAKTTNVMAINSMILMAEIDAFNICSCGIGKCIMDPDVNVSTIKKENGVKLYNYNMTNTTNKCLFVASYFITNDCEINDAAVVYFEKCITIEAINITCIQAIRYIASGTTTGTTTDATTDDTTDATADATIDTIENDTVIIISVITRGVIIVFLTVSVVVYWLFWKRYYGSYSLEEAEASKSMM